MPKSKKLEPASGSLVKSALANRLRDEISSGALPPGVRIIEGTWGRKLGVAQGSIREAINLLAQEGFVTKVSGRSARVVSLNERDVLHLYEIRGAIEGLAARLAATRQADVAELQQMVDAMRHASKKNRTADLVDAGTAIWRRISGSWIWFARAKAKSRNSTFAGRWRALRRRRTATGRRPHSVPSVRADARRNDVAGASSK
jgi:DNA-binding GntR family transcriptional regulator